LTVSQKAALSLLITVVLFAGFTVLAFTGLFDLVESRFYNPSIVSSLTREVNTDAQAVDKFFTELENRFSLTLQEDSVKRSFLPNQSAEDIFERSRIYGMLMESLGGFQGVKFIDNGGTRIHYSTYQTDILRQDRLSTAYHNYADADFPYSRIASSDQAGLKLIFDEAGHRILFSLPFYDSFDVFRGTVLFSLSTRAIAERLIGEGRIKVGETVSIVSEPVGIVLGVPPVSEAALVPGISSVWNEGILSLTSMDSVSGTSLALLSTKTSQGFFLGSLINESRFVFPQLMKIILLGAFFLTVYLTVFLLFNLRQDSFTIVQNRLKHLQISLIEQYYDRKNDIDWGRWSRELEQRREEIRAELKQGIKNKAGKNKTDKDEKNDIDVLIDKSWDELLNVIAGRRDKSALIDEEKLQTILNRILSAGASIPAPAAGVPAANVPAPLVRAETPAAAEEVEELAEAESVEEIEELSEAEPVEDLEELTDAEPVEEVEELAEAEPVEDVEELTEVEPVEDLEELTDAEPVEEAEKLTEAEPVKGAEELAEVEPVEDLEELTDTEPVEEAEKLTEAEPVEGAEEIEEVPPARPAVPELAEIGDIELTGTEIDKVMAVQDDGEPAELEELDELDEAETGESEKVDKTEELEELDQPAADDSPSKPPRMSEMDLANLVSQIEFSSSPSKEEEDTTLEKELEIVSPFATMLSDFSDDREDTGTEAPPLETVENSSKTEPSDNTEEGEKKKPEEEEEKEKVAAAKRNESGLETLNVQHGMSLIYKPFLYADFSDPQDLESLPNDPEKRPPEIRPSSEEEYNTDIIEEHEGVHYINREILNPDPQTEKGLNPDFKNLVDSVIK
jgi:hypothetical protein